MPKLSLDTLLLSLAVALTIVGMWWMARRRRLKEKADTALLAQAHAEGRGVPQTLHPVVDTDKCMGSLSCLSACPEGDILGVVDGKAALVSPSSCIGHGKCAIECPVNAITLVFGTSQRGVDLPEVNEFFETSRAGVHIVGELGGMGLIKNAITQGLQCAQHLGKTVSAKGGDNDVVIVGAGPAGLATALGLKEKGLRFKVLEQDSVGGTIAHYPRQKVVMTERVQLPFYGKFGKPLISKEELLDSWAGALKKSHVSVDEGVKVERIDGQDGAFTVHTSKGTFSAKKVVLAVGRRGTPRKLGVPGEQLEKVAYRLVDPQQYEGSRVAVVGGGDAALEAAISLAESTESEVVLSYRQAELGKAREANKTRFKELVDAGRIFAFMPSTVTSIGEKDLVLSHDGKPVKLPNDFVIACLGGELPAPFLEANGIGMKRLHGDQLGAKAGRGSAREATKERRQRWLAIALFALGAAIVATLFVVGGDYYLASQAERLKHPAHAWLKPAGTWGHGVGIVATLFMMSNFFYAARKRWESLKGFSDIRTWLTFHQFVGFMSPLVIAFHAAFRSNNQLATVTAVALAIVVSTGVVGRFLWSWVPGGDDKTGELGELQKRWERLKQRVKHDVEGLTQHESITQVLERAVVAPPERSLFAYALHLPGQYLKDRSNVRALRPLFGAGEGYGDFKVAFFRLRTLQAQVSFFKALKRLMSTWRIFHVTLALLLVVLIAAHIGVSLFLGYTWIFKK